MPYDRIYVLSEVSRVLYESELRPRPTTGMPGHALGQACRGPRECRKLDPSAHQRVVEHHDAQRALGFRIQLGQPCDQCFHARSIGDERRVAGA